MVYVSDFDIQNLKTYLWNANSTTPNPFLVLQSSYPTDTLPSPQAEHSKNNSEFCEKKQNIKDLQYLKKKKVKQKKNYPPPPLQIPGPDCRRGGVHHLNILFGGQEVRDDAGGGVPQCGDVAFTLYKDDFTWCYQKWLERHRKSILVAGFYVENFVSLTLLLHCFSHILE